MINAQNLTKVEDLFSILNKYKAQLEEKSKEAGLFGSIISPIC